jgi:hypothetical protein
MDLLRTPILFTELSGAGHGGFYFYFLKVWRHAVTLFVHVYITRPDIHHINYSSSTLLLSSLLLLGEGLLWSAKPIFELGPAL